MATPFVSFNVVRPVLFACTLAVAWLTFSAPSGAADTGTDPGSVLGTISAAAPVSSTASGAAGRVGSGLDTSVAAAPASAVRAAPAPHSPTPAAVDTATARSVPERPAGPATVPVIPFSVVNGFDPAETVVTAIGSARPVMDAVSPVANDAAVPNAAPPPVTHLVTEFAAKLGTVDPSPAIHVVQPVVEVLAPVAEVVPPVLDVVPPVLEVLPPVLEVVPPVVEVLAPVAEVVPPVAEVLAPVAEVVPPVAEVLAPVAEVLPPVRDDEAVPDATPQPVTGPVTDEAPLLVSDFVPGTVHDDLAMVLSAAPAADAGTAAGSTALRSAGPLSSTPCGLLTGLLSTLPVSAAAGPGFHAGPDAARGSSGGATPKPMPQPMPAPVSGPGAAQASGGSQSPAAWLSNNFQHFSVPGSVPVNGSIQHVPAPVSFDPGSFPD